jgi:hypothetical protein
MVKYSVCVRWHDRGFPLSINCKKEYPFYTQQMNIHEKYKILHDDCKEY